VLWLRPLAFATFLVWWLRIGACGVGAYDSHPPNLTYTNFGVCDFSRLAVTDWRFGVGACGFWRYRMLPVSVRNCIIGSNSRYAVERKILNIVI